MHTELFPKISLEVRTEAPPPLSCRWSKGTGVFFDLCGCYRKGSSTVVKHSSTRCITIQYFCLFLPILKLCCATTQCNQLIFKRNLTIIKFYSEIITRVGKHLIHLVIFWYTVTAYCKRSWWLAVQNLKYFVICLLFVRYLHQKDPHEWTVDRLAESFPVDKYGVKKILKSSGPRSLEGIQRLDFQVSRFFIRFSSNVKQNHWQKFFPTL